MGLFRFGYGIGLDSRGRFAKMGIGGGGADAASGGTHDEAKLHEVGLIHIFNGDGIFPGYGGQRIQPHRAAVTGEDAVTIEDVYEPYLMQLGFIMRTPRGRICTPAAYTHLGKIPPAVKQDASADAEQTQLF